MAPCHSNSVNIASTKATLSHSSNYICSTNSIVGSIHVFIIIIIVIVSMIVVMIYYKLGGFSVFPNNIQSNEKGNHCWSSYQWVKRWPTDLADRVRSPLEAKSSRP